MNHNPWYAAGTVAAAALLAVVAAGCGAEPTTGGVQRPVEPADPVTDTPQEPASDASGGAPQVIGSCVGRYRPRAIAARAFAFDGTVVAIGPSATGEDDEAGPALVGVTFRVNEWFRAGGSRTVTVDMPPPQQTQRSSVGSVTYEEGSRLLVSGEPRWGGAALDDPIAWSCGFTRTFDTGTATAWRRAAG